jgi:hypothetical protein
VIPADFFIGAVRFVRAGGFTVLTALVPDFDPEDPETFFVAAIDALQTGQSGRIDPNRETPAITDDSRYRILYIMNDANGSTGALMETTPR